jgi:ribosomal protein S4
MNSIASYQVKINDVVTFRKAETAKIPPIETSMARPDYVVPSWLKRENASVQLLATPNFETLEKQLNLRLIIEFYSK